MKIGILQTGHSPEEMLEAHGNYSDRFSAMLGGHDFTFETFSVVAGVFPAGPQDADGWLITGSKHGAYEDHAWIPPLEDLIRAIYASTTPMIGVCFGHQIIARNLDLAGAIFPFLQRRGFGDFGTKDQVLDLHDALRMLVPALDNGDGTVAFIRVFQLVTKALGVPEVDFGTNTRLPQLGNHCLVIGHPALIHDGDNHGARCRFIQPPLCIQCRQQPVHPDGDTRRGYFLSRESFDKVVIPAAPCDGAEIPRAPILVLDLEGEFGFIDGAGVVTETAHHVRIDLNLIMMVSTIS